MRLRRRRTQCSAEEKKTPKELLTFLLLPLLKMSRVGGSLLLSEPLKILLSSSFSLAFRRRKRRSTIQKKSF